MTATQPVIVTPVPGPTPLPRPPTGILSCQRDVPRFRSNPTEGQSCPRKSRLAATRPLFVRFM